MMKKELDKIYNKIEGRDYNNCISYRIKDFYPKFRKKNKKFPVQDLPFEKTRKRKKAIEYKLYKKIISTYLNIYFKDFYRSKNPVYFFLGGLCKKVLYTRKIYNSKTKRNNKRKRIGLMWFDRPSSAIYFKVVLKKLRGSTSKFVIFEKKWRENNDIGFIPKFEKEIRQLKKSKKMFR